MFRNKRLASILLGFGFVLLLLNSTIGLALFKQGYDWIFPNNVYEISFSHLILMNLDRFLSNSTGIIVSIWFIIQSRNLENKYFWIIAGFLFGSLTLILHLILLIIQGVESKTDYQKPIKSVLIILICVIPLKPVYTLFIDRHIQNVIGPDKYGFLLMNNSYLHFFSFAIMSIFNVWLGFKIYSYVKKFGKKPFIWMFATFFLGVIPLILFNLLEMIRIKK